MAVKPVVYDDSSNKHRPLGSGEKMDGLSASSVISSQSGNLITAGSDGLAYATGSGIADPAADNLIEATPSGKLKMDVDRLAEWLDGHPADAKALSEAIKVVSGDSGNVITKGSDKGAYLSAMTLASAIGSMSAAQLQQLASALADGKTIVASNGKLTVDPTSATAAQLSKISTALRKAGSGLSVDPSTGKLVVDFASMDPAIMRAVVLSMVQQGGGIGVDSAGQLYVDFDSMPTNKFEAMLKSLKMLVPLDANKTLYVSTNNAAAGDTIIDGRGTAAKPFKTIQACVNYVTGTYSVGRFHVTIRVVAGTYNENVALPDFSRGTGYIEIVPDSGARDVIVQAQVNQYGTRGWCFNASGGFWILRYMDARRVESPTQQKSQALGCYQASGTAILDLYGCAARQSMPSSTSVLGGENYTVRIISADGGGTVRFRHGVLPGVISAQAPAVGDYPAVDVLNVARQGSLWLVRGYDEDNDPVTTQFVECSGSCRHFLYMWQGGKINTLSGGNIITFTGSVTGKRYNLTGGSFVAGVGGSETFFPGSEGGTVDTSTYCWYA